MNDPIKSLGRILQGGEKRDAVHIAIMPAIAGEDLAPGISVGLTNDGPPDLVIAKNSYLGIVDPFLTGTVRKGSRFWVFLYPNTVSGMRHEWTHPLLDARTHQPKESVEWLHDFADKWMIDYDEMIAEAPLRNGQAWAAVEMTRGIELKSDEENLFWEHIEKLTGQRFNDVHRGLFQWRCSC